MIKLPNDCNRSEFIFYPKNWDKKEADMSESWQLLYRFYEPGRKVKLVKVKGMNSFKDLKERQKAMRLLIDETTSDLDAGFNPNIKDFTLEHVGEVNPNTLFYHALQYALDNCNFIKETKKEIEWVLRHTKPAAEALNYLHLSIGDIRQKHIMTLLQKCKKLNPKLSNNSYNVYRKYLYKLFKLLKQYQAVELNPVQDIEKLPVVEKIRASLSKEDQFLINRYLMNNYPAFHRFLHIFFHSGCRIKELMRVQVKDVNLKNQEFKATIFKGRRYVEVLKAINDEVLPLWKSQLENTKPDDYVFGEALLPNATPVKAYQIGKRWYRLVKKPLGVEADFYSLKHSKITAVNDAIKQDEERRKKLAKELASHSSENVIAKVYDLNADQRRRDELKKIKTPFGAK